MTVFWDGQFSLAYLAAGTLLAAVAAGLAGCKGQTPGGQLPGTSPPAGAAAIRVQSPAFGPGQPIPRKHTGDGPDLSPALSWSGVPAGAKQLALVMDDPDAPRAEPWVHWVIYGIGADVTALPEGVQAEQKLPAPPGAVQGRNSWGKFGYGGPQPPPGKVHHYHFKLYAVADVPALKPGLEKQELLQAIAGHVLAEGELVGTYKR